ncbi:MAG TPA: FAD-dependent oxidoreductase [Nitrospira sp.]|nr:FAD-dependent oxidoreductase [Nitrospira sp.]
MCAGPTPPLVAVAGEVLLAGETEVLEDEARETPLQSPQRPSGRGSIGPDYRKWAVVGGGLLGLTLALRLAQQGQNVTLIEAADHLGGLADAWRLGDVVWDRHYHVTLLSDTHLRRILEEIGVEKEMVWSRTGSTFYADGVLYPFSGVMDYIRLPILSPLDKMRLGATILHASRLKDPRRLETILIEPWLTALSGRRAFDRFWRPLLEAKLGDNYHKTAAAFMWATIQRFRAFHRSGLKTEMCGYAPGGYAGILEAFARTLGAKGVRIALSSPVSRVERAEGSLRITYASGAAEEFDRVVVTAAAPVAARMCPGLRENELSRLRSIDYMGIVCASALLRKPLSNTYLTYITDPAIPLTGIVEMSALVDRSQFNGHALVYLPRYVTAKDPFLNHTDEEVESMFLAALAKVHPHFSPDDVLCFKVSRVRNVTHVLTLNYSDALPPMSTSIPGLSIVNSAHIVYGTLNVNETVKLAEDAVPRLLRQTA